MDERVKNYAIIIGVSKYLNAIELPACKNDLEIMEQLLQATQKYNILCINEMVSKSTIIEKIENFFAQDMSDDSTEIGEILFYFTGHGYQDTEAHFCLYDTSLEKINSTSLNNNEIDGLIRRYSPKLYVKIIDACQSGLSYIKSISEDNDRLKISPSQNESEKGMENCIFMCSSKKNQVSLATKEYSLFTKSFVGAVMDAPAEKPIRFIEIQNYITDAFNSENVEQTPYFVVQADGRDIFTTQTVQLKALVESLNKLASLEVETNIDIRAEGNTKVEEFLRQYRSKDAVKDILGEIKDISTSFQFPDTWIAHYYTYSFENCSSKHSDETSIAKFLYNRRNSENLYIEVETEGASKRNLFGLETWTTYPVSFTSVARELPTAYSFILKPKQEGLPEYEISFVFIYSDTYFYIFSDTKEYVTKGWSNRVEGQSIGYKYTKMSYQDYSKEKWLEFMTSQVEKGTDFIETALVRFVGQI